MCAQTAKQALRQELLSSLFSYFHADSAFGDKLLADLLLSLHALSMMLERHSDTPYGAEYLYALNAIRLVSQRLNAPLLQNELDKLAKTLEIKDRNQRLARIFDFQELMQSLRGE